MKIGKLDNQDLRRLVLDRLPAQGQFVASGPAVGVDCSAIRFCDGQVILSTDPITGAAAEIGRLSVLVTCNDIAACGIRPSALLLTIIAPPQTTADEIRMVIDQASTAAQKINVSIVGGHTEVSDAVTRFVVSATALGFTYGQHIIQASGAQPGDLLVMTKTAGLEGTAILASDHAKKLIGKLSEQEILEAKALLSQISVVEEGSIGGDLAVHAMHDATEGGILGACWEMAEASGLGCRIDAAKIPVHPLTDKICSILAIDPRRLVASGSMIIATNNAENLLTALADKGIRATVIGKMTETRQKIADYGHETMDLLPPGPDELYKIR